jgi:hypothetical protein
VLLLLGIDGLLELVEGLAALFLQGRKLVLGVLAIDARARLTRNLDRRRTRIGGT